MSSHMNYCDLSLVPSFSRISIHFYGTVSQKSILLCFFNTALQTPSSCVMNNGGKYHLALQPFFPSSNCPWKAAIATRYNRNRSPFISRHNKLCYAYNAPSSLSRTMQQFGGIFRTCCTDEGELHKYEEFLYVFKGKSPVCREINLSTHLLLMSVSESLHNTMNTNKISLLFQ